MLAPSLEWCLDREHEHGNQEYTNSGSAVVLVGRVCEWDKDRSPSLSVQISIVGSSDSGYRRDREKEHQTNSAVGKLGRGYERSKSNNPTPLVQLSNWTGECEWSKYREPQIFQVLVKLERVVYGYKKGALQVI